MATPLVFARASAALLWLASAALARDNVLLLIDESTDGRAYFAGQTPPMPIPNLQRLMREGVTFNWTYAASPVCCPSRAALWSGRHAHDVPHAQPLTNLPVRGAWNNNEGLDKAYPHTIDQVLARSGAYRVRACGGGACVGAEEGDDGGGYAVATFDKLDRYSGAHTTNVKVEAWTNKVNFPYDVDDGFVDASTPRLNRSGWADEGGPVAQTVGNSSQYWKEDWDAVDALAGWIRNQSGATAPWFAYLGANIAHPNYVSDASWLATVDLDHPALRAPRWEPVADMHPEDFRASLLKGLGSEALCCDDAFKVSIRQHYFAMIAEYDAMVGRLLAALDASAQAPASATWVIATADHGDMNMEHRQYYKMDWHDASARVPLIIAGPRLARGRAGSAWGGFASLVDLFPTILELCGVARPAGANATGVSLAPHLLAPPGGGGDGGGRAGAGGDDARAVLTQFAGDNVHLPWFALLQRGDPDPSSPNATRYKYVAFGSGRDVPPRLFDLDRDPDEARDLIAEGGARALDALAPWLERRLDEAIANASSPGAGTSGALAPPFRTYREVATEIESYNKQSFALWRASFGGNASAYEAALAGLRWAPFWARDPDGCLRAIDAWLATTWSNDTADWNCTYLAPPASWVCPWESA